MWRFQQRVRVQKIHFEAQGGQATWLRPHNEHVAELGFRSTSLGLPPTLRQTRASQDCGWTGAAVILEIPFSVILGILLISLPLLHSLSK